MAVKAVLTPIPIDDCEPLVRAISTPSCVDEEFRVTNLAFRLKARIKEKDISLSRLRFESLMDFLRRSLTFRFYFLGPQNVPFGAAELLAAEVKSLNEHVVLEPSEKMVHASIYFRKEDGTYYTAGEKTTDPVGAEILIYEMKLASIVRKVYDLNGNIVWAKQKDSMTI